MLFAAGCGGGSPSLAVANLGAATTTNSTPSANSSAGGTPAGGSAASASGGSEGGAVRLAVGGSVEQMTDYAACMRSNGVPDFPDPNAQGQLSFAFAGFDPRSAQFQHAQQTCQKDLPKDNAPSPALQTQARQQSLAFSACMRSHGVPNFPDPQFGSNGQAAIRISPSSGIDPQSSQFQAAQQACRNDTPGGALKAGPPPSGP